MDYNCYNDNMDSIENNISNSKIKLSINKMNSSKHSKTLSEKNKKKKKQVIKFRKNINWHL